MLTVRAVHRVRRATTAYAAVLIAGVMSAPVVLLPVSPVSPASPAVPVSAVSAARADEVRDRQRPVIQTLGLEEAWRTSRGKGVTVGLIDTGVNTAHVDLKGSVTVGPNFLSEVDRGIRPHRLHGTMMASLIAGHGHGAGRRAGMVGVAPEAKILSVRALPDREDANYTAAQVKDPQSIVRAIRYAADQKVSVINLSLGGYGDDPDQREAIAYAVERGVVVVAGVGNDGAKKNKLDADGFAPYFYPASYPGVIGVAATTPKHSRASFSNRNYSVLISAPGDRVIAAGNDADYYLAGGTSHASAMVSGVAALVRSKYPGLPPALVAQALISGAVHRPADGYSADTGYGEVNAARALREAARLSRYAPVGKGLSDAQRFVTGDPKPVKVIDRPAWWTVGLVTMLAIALSCALAAFIVTGLLARRRM